MAAMKKHGEKAIGCGGGMKECLHVVIPLIFAMGASAINQFVDRLFLAHYSAPAIEGSLPGGMLGWFFIGTLMATVAYSGTFVAQYHGAGNPRGAVRSLGQGLWLSLAAAPLCLALVPVGTRLFAFAGASPEVQEAERGYFSIMMLGASLSIAQTVLAGSFSGIRRTRLAGAAMLAGNAVNIPLDWILIFGMGPIPAMGIEGAALGSVLAQGLTCTVLATALPFDATFKKAGVKRLFRFVPSLSWRILKFGFASGLQISIDCLTFTIFVMMTSRLDAMSLAVSNIVFSINHLSFAPLCGMGQGAGVLVGNYQGAKDRESARRAGWNCIFIAWAYFALFAILILAFGGSFMDAFHSSASGFDGESFRALGMELMAILLAWGLFDATDIVITGALKGAGDTRFVMLAYGGIGLFLWMPSFMAIMHFVPGIKPLWLTMPAYCGICAVLTVWRWLSGRWSRIALIEETQGDGT